MRHVLVSHRCARAPGWRVFQSSLASSTRNIDAASGEIPEGMSCGLVFGPEGFFIVHRAHIAELTLARRLPTIFDVRDCVEAGGLSSYGSDFYNVIESHRQLRRACAARREAGRPAGAASDQVHQRQDGAHARRRSVADVARDGG